jgi:copper chaperone CopZ
MTRHSISVSGMRCENCERIVTEALADLGAVEEASADADAGEVVVSCDADGAALAREAIAGLGYGIEE